MHPYVRQLITEWRRLELPFEGQTVVVAVSGGADSVSLLLGFNELQTSAKLRHRLVAAHFNHKLRRPESDGDEQFVRELTGGLGIELAIGSGNVSMDGNMEQNARHARYDFLRTTAANVDAFAVLTGHTINDQAETLLMNLIRGSGPEGLSGMKPIRPLPAEQTVSASVQDQQPNTMLVRPLLTWAKRIQTEA